MSVRINIVPAAETSIRRLAAESRDGRETGGILFGRGPDPEGLLVVDQAGDPGPNARREPGFFLRDLRHAQRLADAAWQERRAIWVGEWHTHLHGDPQPSGRDLTTYSGLLSAAELAFVVLVSVIVVAHPQLGWDEPVLVPWLLTAHRSVEPETTRPEAPHER